MSAHSNEAERELARADGDIPRWTEGNPHDAEVWKAERIATAQVHATLAVAAELENIFTLLNNSGAMA